MKSKKSTKIDYDYIPAKAEDVIEEIELEYLEFVESDIEKRKLLLPVTGDKNIKALMYNLFASEKWIETLSYREYSKIIDIWLSRI